MRKTFTACVLVLALSVSAEAGGSKWFKTAKGWLKAFRLGELRAVDLAEFRSGLEARCKIAEADKGRLDELKATAADSLAAARLAWHDWRQGLGVEASVDSRVEAAELAADELQKLLDQSREAEAACRPAPVVN